MRGMRAQVVSICEKDVMGASTLDRELIGYRSGCAEG